jgi:hypothetical protein
MNYDLEHVMKYDLDDIQCIQALLAELPCGGCCRQRLVLLLRYNPHRKRCLFMAFCEACRMKHPIPPDIARRLNNQKPNADDQEFHA